MLHNVYGVMALRLRGTIGVGASQARLSSLLESRLQAGADTAAIDERIWNLFGERWAVMFTDLSGFSRHVAEFGITHFLQIIYESERLLMPIIEANDGILLKVEGDSLLVIFRSPSRAVAAAVAMQRTTVEYNATRPDAEQVLLCVGLGVGEILRIGDDDVFGAEVNAASKLGEDTAGPGDILVTDSMHEFAVANDAVVGAEKLSSAPPGAEGAFRLDYA